MNFLQPAWMAYFDLTRKEISRVTPKKKKITQYHEISLRIPKTNVTEIARALHISSWVVNINKNIVLIEIY